MTPGIHPPAGVPARRAGDGTSEPRRTALIAGLSTTGAALGFGSLFTDGGSWAISPLLCIIVVGLVGLGGRLLSMAMGWIVFAQIVSVVVLLTAIYAGDVAYAGLVPDLDALQRLGDLAAEGMEEARSKVAPIAPTSGTTLLITFLVAPAAITVDRLAAARRAAVAGLPLFVMYAVITAILRTPLPILTYLLPVVGFLAMLWLDESVRKSSWGAMSHPGRRAGDQIGLAVAAVAIVLGVLVPAIVPTPAGGLFELDGGGGNSRAPTITASRLTDMGGQLNLNNQIKLMSVRTSSAVTKPPYLRTVVLDAWTAQGWRQLPSSPNVSNLSQLPSPQTTVTTRTVRARVSVQAFNDRYAPVYYSPKSVLIGGGFFYDDEQSVIYSQSRRMQGQTYSITATMPVPTPEELQSAGQSTPGPSLDLQRPAQVSAQVKDLVAGLVAGKTTAYDKTMAINTYFTDTANGFSYSLTVPEGDSGDQLVDFLQIKQGFCEQYASAMASMLRLAQVPARVVIGYTPGKKQPDGSWQVTTDDAHAWVEAYIGDAGWVQFDPTPIGNRANPLPYAPRGGAEASSSATASASASAPLSANVGPEQNLDDQQTAASGSASDGLSWGQVLLIAGGAAVVVLLLGAPALLRVLRRRRRLKAAAGDDEQAAHMAWQELLSSARDYRRAPEDAQTPRRVVGSWRRDLRLKDDELDAALAVMLAEEEASYAPAYTARPNLPQSVRTVRGAMARNAERKVRLRAALLPPTWWERRPRGTEPGDPPEPADPPR